MYCGVVMSRNSVPAGRPRLLTADSTLRASRRPLLMSKAAVEVGVVDQPLPSDRGARLLEIDAHHDLEAVGKLFAQGGEALGVVYGGDGIVDRAGADDDQQAVVGPVQDGVDGVARRHHHPRRGQGARYLAHHLLRRTQFFQFANSKIVGGAQHGCGSCSLGTCRPIKKPPGLAAVRTSWLQFVRLSAILPPPASCRS